MRGFSTNPMIALRKIEPTDLPFLYQWENDASAWADGANHNPLSQQDLREYIASTTGDIFKDGQLRLVIQSVSEAVCTLSATIPRSMSEKVAVLKEHVLASISWCGNDERKGIIHSRRHFAASPIFKGLTDFKQTRIALLRAETVAEVFAIMDEIVSKWGNDEMTK